jgi:uncharacterized protein
MIELAADRLEAHRVLADEVSSWLRNDSLHLILLPTEHCNFRCTYCYEDFIVGRMEAATIQGVKRLIDRRIDGLEGLTVSWFGGEPLLALPIVEDISQHIVTLAASWPQLHYHGDMTTNGYFLDRPLFDRLVGLGIRLFQISLDGPALAHDRTRIRADGLGTFKQIWENLCAIRASAAPVSMLLRVHLTPENLPLMPDFLTEIRETFLDDARFTVLLKPIERLGGPNDAAMTIIAREDRARIMADFEAILRQGVATRHAIFDAPEICYAARPNSFVIRANGIVGKCTVGLTDPANMVGRLSADGRLEIDNARLRPWLRGWSTMDTQTLGCPYGEMAEPQPKLLQVQRRPASTSRSTPTR